MRTDNGAKTKPSRCAREGEVDGVTPFGLREGTWVMDMGIPAAACVLIVFIACVVRFRSFRRVLGVGALVMLLATMAYLSLSRPEVRHGSKLAVIVETRNVRVSSTNYPAPTSDASREVSLERASEAVWPFHKSLAADAYPTRDRAITALAAQSVKELHEGLARASQVLVATQDEAGLTQELVAALSREAPQLEVKPARVPNLARLVRPAREEKVDVERLTQTFATEIGAAIAAQLQEYLTLNPSSVARRALRTARWAFSSEAAVLEVSEQAGEHEGTLTARLSYTTLAGQRIERKRFLLTYGERPWVVAAHGPGHSESASYVGRSALEPTPEAALRAARARAWQRLRVDVQNRVSDRHLSIIERMMLRRGGLDRDIKRIVGTPWTAEQEFVQALELERGPAYRAAVRMAPVNVAQAARHVVDRARMMHQTMLMRVLGLLLLGALTYGGYRIIDAGTRGHFTWRWRFVSAVAFVTVAAFALLFVA